MLTAITQLDGAQYPTEPPFYPDTPYPEYAFDHEVLSERNDAYRLVRETLRELQLDIEHYDTPEWNPMGDFIKPGDRVVIKPNLVQDRHYRGGDINCLITHGSVVRAVMDYVYIALKGEGSILLGDAPVLSTRFDKAIECAQLHEVLSFYKKYARPELSWFDFRKVAGDLDERFHVIGWKEQDGDPAGTVTFDLGEKSMLTPVNHLAHLYRLPHYRHGDTTPYHKDTINKYTVPKCIIDADVIINLPKMKTHCKAGITAALKNFIGIVAVRHCYTNFRRGSPAHGGDEYPDASIIKTISDFLERRIDGNSHGLIRKSLVLLHRINEQLGKIVGVDSIRDGAWYGNDTVWRAILDLVRIARYGLPDGSLSDTPQRTLFTLTDGIIAGEGEGPLIAESKDAGCIIAGLNPLATDTTIATLMQYDWHQISVLREGEQLADWPLISQDLSQTVCHYQNQTLSLNDLAAKKLCSPFAPPYGWVGHIELNNL